MTGGKQLKEDTSYSENNPRTCGIESRGTSVPCGCNSLFTCCLKRTASKETSSDFACNDEYDYIVEKLVIKRVPIGLFATPYDVYKSKDKESAPDGLLPASDSQKVYPMVQAVNSSLFYTSTTSAGPTGFPNRPSNKTLRFTRNEDVFDDDALNATTSGYKDDKKSGYRDTELLNKFTALHPHLKETERAPKDPCPLNTTRSRRSLAEEISEIAATKESPNLHYERTKNECVTTGSVYTAQPRTSGELSTLPVVEEIPTRDKAEENSSRYRTASSSCFPFGWRSESRDEETEAEASISRTEESLTDVQESSVQSKNQNYIVAPVQVHYASPNLENIRKIMRDERNRIDAASENKEKLNFEIFRKGNENVGRLEESSADGNSEASEGPTIENLAGTTLRWKIIIKHRPPGSPSTSGTTKGSSRPKLSKGLRDTIEARIRRDSSTSSKNDRGSRNKRKEEVPKRTL